MGEVTQQIPTELQQTRQLLMRCKQILSKLPPLFFVGAGLQWSSLVARQVFLEKLPSKEPELGWMTNLENSGWVLRHQREAGFFADYCECVGRLRGRGVPIDVILRECSSLAPETQMAPALIASEGVRKVLQWLSG